MKGFYKLYHGWMVSLFFHNFFPMIDPVPEEKNLAVDSVEYLEINVV